MSNKTECSIVDDLDHNPNEVLAQIMEVNAVTRSGKKSTMEPAQGAEGGVPNPMPPIPVGSSSPMKQAHGEEANHMGTPGDADALHQVPGDLLTEDEDEDAQFQDASDQIQDHPDEDTHPLAETQVNIQSNGVMTQNMDGRSANSGGLQSLNTSGRKITDESLGISSRQLRSVSSHSKFDAITANVLGTLDPDDIPHFDTDTDLCTITLEQYDKISQTLLGYVRGKELYKKESSSNAQELNRVRDEFQELEEKYDDLHKAWRAQSIESTSMDNQIQSLKASKAHYDNRIVGYINETTRLGNEIDDLKRELDSNQDTIQRLQDEIQQLQSNPQDTSNSMQSQFGFLQSNFNSLATKYKSLCNSYQKAKDNFAHIMNAVKLDSGNFQDVSKAVVNKLMLTNQMATGIQTLAIHLMVDFENKTMPDLINEISLKVALANSELLDVKAKLAARTASCTTRASSTGGNSLLDSHPPTTTHTATHTSKPSTATTIERPQVEVIKPKPEVTQPAPPTQVESKNSQAEPTASYVPSTSSPETNEILSSLMAKMEAWEEERNKSKGGEKELVPPKDLTPTAIDLRLKEHIYMALAPDFGQAEKVGKMVVQGLGGKMFSENHPSLLNKWMDILETESDIANVPAKFLALNSCTGEAKKVIHGWHAKRYTWVQIKWLIKEQFGLKHVQAEVKRYLTNNKQHGRSIEVYITSTTNKLRDLGVSKEDLTAEQKDLFLGGLDDKQLVREITNDLCKEYSENYPCSALIKAMRQYAYSQTHYNNVVKGNERISDTLAVDQANKKQKKFGGKTNEQVNKAKPKQSKGSPSKKEKWCKFCNVGSHKLDDCWKMEKAGEEFRQNRHQQRRGNRNGNWGRRDSSRDAPRNANGNAQRNNRPRRNSGGGQGHDNPNHNRDSSPRRSQNIVQEPRGNTAGNEDQGNE